jgi:hypothetical protein
VKNLEIEKNNIKSKYEERLRSKDIELREQTEHLIQRLNTEVKRTKEEMNNKMRNELASTTKQTMEENLRLMTELQFQSHRIHKLVNDNTKLNKSNKSLKRDVSSHKEMELTNAKRIRFYTKLFVRMQKEEEDKKNAILLKDAEKVKKESMFEKEGLLRNNGDDGGIIAHRYSEIDRSLNLLINDNNSVLLNEITEDLLINSKKRNNYLNVNIKSMFDERNNKMKKMEKNNENGLSDHLNNNNTRPGRILKKSDVIVNDVQRPSDKEPKTGQWSFPKFQPPVL